MDYTLLIFIAIEAYSYLELLIKYIYNSVILRNIFINPSRMVYCPQRFIDSGSVSRCYTHKMALSTPTHVFTSVRSLKL